MQTVAARAHRGPAGAPLSVRLSRAGRRPVRIYARPMARRTV